MDSTSSEQTLTPLPVTSNPTTTTSAPSLSNGAPDPAPETTSTPPSTEAATMPETTSTPPSTEAATMPETTANGAPPADPTNDPTPTNGPTNGHAPPARPFPTLAGKVALVTGASRGIGAGIALELGARGASIIVNYVKGHDAAHAICAQIHRLGSHAHAIQADVSLVPEITRLFLEAKAHFGRIDIVCSNSGMESFDRTAEVTEARFDAVMGLNLRAQFFVGQAAYRHCERGGRLILMSSIAAGLIGVGDHALYSGSKSAVNGITKSFAKDFGDRRITVNAVAPGGVKSDMFAQVAWKYIPGATGEWGAERVEKAMADSCPLGRCAVPEDVARVVAFLAGEDGGWVNGQIITISGGSGQ
ncbi:hypothetical protein HO173_005239 [Letharia columbiana]|uniref:Uncharacterized protein n=1 Tax=Letharia columbiana TaxID=112416 RepID=A0A8H6FX42_9LECA|nr:uncharacterized protein HO173_005239 [Letharia columbiana]KAF6236458.1 hypothetical protein HO173_005239 [Letharia columbiana]